MNWIIVFYFSITFVNQEHQSLLQLFLFLVTHCITHTYMCYVFNCRRWCLNFLVISNGLICIYTLVLCIAAFLIEWFHILSHRVQVFNFWSHSIIHDLLYVSMLPQLALLALISPLLICIALVVCIASLSCTAIIAYIVFFSAHACVHEIVCLYIITCIYYTHIKIYSQT